MSKITALNSIAATLKFSSMSADEPQKSTMSVVVTLFFVLCYIMTPTDDTAILFFFQKLTMILNYLAALEIFMIFHANLSFSIFHALLQIEFFMD